MAEITKKYWIDLKVSGVTVSGSAEVSSGNVTGIFELDEEPISGSTCTYGLISPIEFKGTVSIDCTGSVSASDCFVLPEDFSEFVSISDTPTHGFKADGTRIDKTKNISEKDFIEAVGARGELWFKDNSVSVSDTVEKSYTFFYSPSAITTTYAGQSIGRSVSAGGTVNATSNKGTGGYGYYVTLKYKTADEVVKSYLNNKQLNSIYVNEHPVTEIYVDNLKIK